jgi:hypothetical protein
MWWIIWGNACLDTKNHGHGLSYLDDTAHFAGPGTLANLNNAGNYKHIFLTQEAKKKGEI